MRAPSSWRLAWGVIRAPARSACRGAATAASASSSSSSTTSSAALPALLLRDYQEECIQSVLASLDRGQKRLGISLATGAGKTVVFTQLLDRVRPSPSGADRTLILAHRRELVEQAARHCSRAYPGKTVEIEMGSLHASGTADITIASVRSITSGQRIAKFNPRQFKLVLVDEAHHIVAPGYMQVLEHFGLDRKPRPSSGEGSGRKEKEEEEEKESEKKKKKEQEMIGWHADTPALVGVSATFSRFDGVALGAAIDEIVYHKDYVDMIGDGWLSDVIFTTVRSTADLSGVRSGGSGKDFQLGELSRAVNTDQANEITVRTWLAQAATATARRRSTLVFCVDLSHVADLTQAFRRRGIDAQFVTGDTDRVTRSSRLDAFRRGEFPVLLNCGVFTEGTDIPGVDCVVLARPTKSRNLLVQMIGRGMRLHAGKTNCHVIDMVSTLETGIMTTPTLFGLSPDELVEGASVADLHALRERKQKQQAEQARRDSDASLVLASSERDRVRSAAAAAAASGDQHPAITSVTFTDYGSVLDLIADTSGERHIRGMSRNAWVQVGKNRYVLSGPTGTYLRIEEADSSSEQDPDANTDADADADEAGCRFRVVEVRALPAGVSKSPFAAPRDLCRVPTFSDAVRAADSYAAKIFPRAFIYRHQTWRKGPPSQGQLDFLNKIRSKDEKKLTADNVTSGAASDMITKIKHGARGWFADIKALHRRKERELASRERQRALRAREIVTVGPLSA